MGQNVLQQNISDNLYRRNREKMLEEKLLSSEALLAGLESVYQEVYGRTLSVRVKSLVEDSLDLTMEEESQRAEELLSFARRKKAEKLVNVVQASISKAILPLDCSAELFDIKIGRNGPDDKVYTKHADIRMMIPRGTTILQWQRGTTKTNTDSWNSVVIYGHKKFTGGVGDEDEEQPENNEKWKEYFVADPKQADNVVCMEKLNGEAAHISCRYIDGQFYLLVGSKNVHMIIRGMSDIDHYEGTRYEYAKVIARTMCETFKGMDNYRVQLLLSFLHYTRGTLVGEILQTKNQHIVDLSHLLEPRVVIVSLTSSFTGQQVDNLLSIPPHHLLDLCSALGLCAASYTVISVDEVLEHKIMIRKQKDAEGEVFYYLNSNEDTIGLVKVKTVWYIVLRALREKAVYSYNPSKKHRRRTVGECVQLTYKRFEEIQKWLRFSDGYLREWQNLAKIFLQWLDEEIKSGVEQPDQIRPFFPLIWKRFLRTTNQSDDIVLE